MGYGSFLSIDHHKRQAISDKTLSMGQRVQISTNLVKTIGIDLN